VPRADGTPPSRAFKLDIVLRVRAHVLDASRCSKTPVAERSVVPCFFCQRRTSETAYAFQVRSQHPPPRLSGPKGDVAVTVMPLDPLPLRGRSAPNEA